MFWFQRVANSEGLGSSTGLKCPCYDLSTRAIPLCEGEPPSTSPFPPSGLDSSKARSGRWSREEERDLVATSRRVKGSGTSEADWERVRSHLSTSAKNRSLLAIKVRYNPIVARHRKEASERGHEGPTVPDLIVDVQESQYRGKPFSRPRCSRRVLMTSMEQILTTTLRKAPRSHP